MRKLDYSGIRFFSLLFLVYICTNSSLAQQVLLSVTPNSGTPGQTSDVVIRGVQTNFKSNISTIDFGAEIQVLKFNILNPETGIASILIGKNANSGFRKITVITGTETVQMENGFEVFVGGGNFRASLEIMPFQSGSLSDFDISIPQSQPILYFTTLYNDNVQRKVKASVTLFKAQNVELLTLFSDWQNLTQLQILRLNNHDYINFKLHSPEGNYFLTEVKQKGTLPPDVYTYKLVVVDEAGNILSTDNGKTVITNPIYNPELISPGFNFASKPEIVYSSFPLFQWFGQADKYDFALYKVNQNQTAEEAIRNVKVFKVDDIKGNSLLYPSYAEKLVDNTQYAWQIKAKVVSSKGIEYLPSEVFRFIYASTSTPGNENSVGKINVIPQESELKTGDQKQFNATVFDLNGIPLQNQKLTWRVVPPIGTITEQGLFTAGKSSGTVAVIAQSGTVNDYATVTIKSAQLSNINEQSWIMDQMLIQLFGLPQNNK